MFINNKGDEIMTVGFHRIQDVLENYKCAVYEKDVERFLSAYDLEVHMKVK